DGHRSQFTTTVTAESITPGMTLDTLVKMPSGPESKIALYENAQHLDNNGQNNGDPSQVAFGGMLTFLDTNAPPPSADGVGPVPAHVKASPNPSDGLSDVTVSADLSDATTGGSVVKQTEFVVDDAVAVGAGYGVPMSGDFTSVSVTGAHGTLPATPAGGSCDPVNGVVPVALLCLSAGKHKIYVRALDAAGNWGVVGSVVFNLPKTGPQTVNGTVDSPANGAVDVDLSATGDDSDAGGNITAAEYFVDNAAGTNGTGIPMTVNRAATVVSEDTTIAAATVAAMTEGTHHLYVHSKDDLGLWGPVLDVPFVVDTTGPTTAAVALGPNPANGVRSDPSNPGYAMISGEVRDETQGSLQSNITNAEAFIDNVRAPGTGLQLLPVDGSLNSPDERVYGLVPLTQIKGLTDGTHQVFLRGKDAAGNWGYVQGSAFVVDKAAPVISQLAVAPNPTNGATTVTVTATIGVQATPIQRAEYWYGTTDPGVGKATQVTPSMPTATTAVATVAVPNPTVASTQQLNIRLLDQAGNWSKTATTTYSVTRGNVIYRNNFEPADPAWTPVTGSGTTVSTAAKLPTSWEPGSTRGLQVVVPTGSNTGVKPNYVTNTSPTAETAYHARFVFNPNSLTAGTQSGTALTLFQAFSGNNTNTQTFALRFTRVGQGTSQVSVILNRNGGTTTSTPLTLTNGAANQIQLDWTSGTNGSVKLTVGASSVTVSGNTGNLRVDTVRLGVITGFTATSAGTAYFDSFSSGRVTAV
ncbi:MAG TPA: hypothetical protein VKB75_00680, partial [Jatrophihabitans sp.]|nr:hypothetical protein [Jatrophihabitans sp.]